MKQFILIALVLFAVQQRDTIQGYFREPVDYSHLQREDVVLYATSWCGYCAKARQLLNENNIPYYEHDIEKSAQALEQFKSLGGNGVPLLLVKGEVIKGYDASRILEAAK